MLRFTLISCLLVHGVVANLFAPSQPSQYYQPGPNYDLSTGLRSDCAYDKPGVTPHAAAYPFKYCRQYEPNTCCKTGDDLDIGNSWQGATGVGAECPYNRLQNKPELQQWYCSGCSPNQPYYVRYYPPGHPEYNHTIIINNSTNATAQMSPIRYYVCPGFVDTLLRDTSNGRTDINNDRMDDCGLMDPNSNIAVSIGKYYTPDRIGREAFLNNFIPPGFTASGFQVYIWSAATAPMNPDKPSQSLFDPTNPNDPRYCFNSGNTLMTSATVLMSLFALVLLLL